MTFMFFVLFVVCMSVSGTCYGWKKYGMSLFAMFWAGYNFSIFIRAMTAP